jgi:hypothetical protein
MRSTHVTSDEWQMTRNTRTAAAGVAIEALYRAQHSQLLAYLIRLVGDHAAAEDLCHEMFIKAFRSWDQQPEVINAHAWLRRIATTRPTISCVAATNPAYAAARVAGSFACRSKILDDHSVCCFSAQSAEKQHTIEKKVPLCRRRKTADCVSAVI